MTREHTPPRLPRGPHLQSADSSREDPHATWFELFFDLVFVLAIALLARKLEHDPSAHGFIGFAALAVPIWWSWVIYTAYAERFDTDEPGYRLLALVAMLGIAAVAVSLERVFHGGDAAFVVAYLVVRAVPLALYLRAGRHVPLGRELAVGYGTGSAVAAALWLGALLLPAPERYGLWALAVLVELLTPFVRRRTVARAPIDAAHLGERFGLFTIIVIGEIVVAVGAGLTASDLDTASGLLAIATFAIAACLWWSYFELVGATAAVRSFAIHMLYVFGHLPLVVGLTAVGAGTLLAIEHATDPALDLATRVALCGGVALFLLATAVIKIAATGAHRHSPRSRLAAAVSALALIPVGASFQPLITVVVLVAVLGTAVIGEARGESVKRRAPHD